MSNLNLFIPKKFLFCLNNDEINMAFKILNEVILEMKNKSD